MQNSEDWKWKPTRNVSTRKQHDIKAAEDLVRSKTKPIETSQQATDNLLLEVEPAKIEGDEFEWSIEVSEQPSRKGAEVSAFSQGSGDIEFNIETAPSSNMKFIVAGAGGVVVLVAILGWLFMGGSSAKAPQTAEVPVQQNSQQVQAPVSTFAAANTASEANTATRDN